MSYQSFNRKKKKPLFYLFLIVVVILYIIFSALSRVGVLDLSIYVKSGVGGVGDFFTSLVSDKEALIIENQFLKDELEKAKLKGIFEQEVYQENSDLLSRLGVSERERVLFSIYSRPGFNLYDSLLVSGGDVSRVSVGDSYYSSEFFALGRVREIRGSTLILGMFSSPGEKTNISLNNSIFIAEGIGSGSMQIKVPRDFSVEKNDAVYLAGEFVKIVGKVKDISSNPQDSFKVVVFKTPVNIFEIDKVEVEIDSAQLTSLEDDFEIEGLSIEQEILNPEIFDSLEEENIENDTN